MNYIYKIDWIINKDYQISNLKDSIKFGEDMLEIYKDGWENIHEANQRLYKIFKENKEFGKEYEPVWIKQCLARKQFYRQNGLPVELNLIIEEMVKNSSFTNSPQLDNHKRMLDNYEQYFYYLKKIDEAQQEIKQIEKNHAKFLINLQEALNTEMPSITDLREKAQKEKEVQELLKKEIEDYKKQWQEYLNTKPLPALPKKQSKIKVLGSKLKAEIKQVFKPLPKPVIRNNIFLPFLV